MAIGSNVHLQQFAEVYIVDIAVSINIYQNTSKVKNISNVNAYLHRFFYLVIITSSSNNY